MAKKQSIKKDFTDAQYDKKTARVKSEFEIFCDMDGVLSDFVGHAKKQGKMKPDGTPDWKSLDGDYKWWVTMPAFKGMKQFYAELKKCGNTRILTAPAVSPACFRAKAEWVENKWSPWALKDLIICAAADKHLLARSNRILIDDREKNINEWVAAGGIGILHKGNYVETLQKLADEMAAYRKRTLSPAAYKKLGL